MLDHYSPGTCGTSPNTYFCGLFDNNIDIASMNAAESAATRARTDATLPVVIFSIGLGGAGDKAPDAFLQHVANDQRSDTHSTTQPTGTYIYVTGTGPIGKRVPGSRQLRSAPLILTGCASTYDGKPFIMGFP